jgi:methionyl-tRNA synthetase
MANKPYYLTTPIYYPNGEPHVGHIYTTLATDTVARYRRLAGDDVYFLTGTDEHGVKMVKTAAEQGVEPAALADKNVAVFREVWKELGVTHDDFIRTTEPRHKLAVQEIVRRLLANGDIYLGGYEGWYDEGQEEFVTETEAKDRAYLAFNRKPLIRYKEPSYFFRLSKWAPKVLEHLKAHPEFVRPESRYNEVVSKLAMRIEQGEATAADVTAAGPAGGDLSISRATLSWGIPLPNDPAHVVYVWIDALSNYITALGYASADETRFQRYWPADLHLIGKEILWFHAVYWPAMLMSLGLPLPKQLYAHGWWVSEGQKMQKTVGNFVGLEQVRAVCNTLGRDALRFYLLRAGPFGSDLDYTQADLTKAYNELGNVLGNLLNRVVNMTTRYRDGVLPAVGETADATDPATDGPVAAATAALPGDLAKAYDALALQQCASLPVELARAANVYIDQTKPFTLAKDPARAARLDTVLNLSAQAIHRALVGLLPILPDKAVAGLAQLGVDPAGKTLAKLFDGPLPAGHKFGGGAVLFPKPA